MKLVLYKSHVDVCPVELVKEYTSYIFINVSYGLDFCICLFFLRNMDFKAKSLNTSLACFHVKHAKGDNMSHNMTVTIEDPLWDKMKKYEDVRWSSVMKSAIKEKLMALEVLDKLMKRSKLTEKEIEDFAIKLGKKVNRAK